MAATNLSAARLRELLHYNPETGVFTWRVGRKGVRCAGAVAGAMNARGYWRIGVDNRRYLAQGLAWLYMTGEFPPGDVDHRDGARANNRWANLRGVTRSVNNQNQRRARKDNRAGLLGVSPNRRKWAASINVDGVKTHLGSFDTPEQAHAAYLAAKREWHPGNML